MVLLTGRPGYFSAGFDLKVFSETPEDTTTLLALGSSPGQLRPRRPFPARRGPWAPRPARASFHGRRRRAVERRPGASELGSVPAASARPALTLAGGAADVAAVRRRRWTTPWSRAVLETQGARAAGLLDRVVPVDELAEAGRAAAEDLTTMTSGRT